MAIWIVTSRPVEWSALISGESFEVSPEVIPFELSLGTHCFSYLLRLKPEASLPEDSWLSYSLAYRSDGDWIQASDWARDRLYSEETSFRFRLASKLSGMLHGSCRKPHHKSQDGLIRADQWVSEASNDPEKWPDILMHSGDQLYADDVAGPFLLACHQLAERLGLIEETLPNTDFSDLSALRADERCYYRRSELLPNTKAGEALKKSFFEGKRKPIFTTDSAQNHLISASEVFAAYLLIWSPECWELVDIDKAPPLSAEHNTRYYQELDAIKAFQAGLGQVARVMAHIPNYMIWDDHDVTDDWNLSAAWESDAYNHPLSRRIIGNAMLGYLIFQGMGNEPEKLINAYGDQLQSWSAEQRDADHEKLIEQLLKQGPWGYEIPIDPGIIVLDTRTQRWRSERDPERPSGLMDWENLVELQQSLLDRKVVVLVSPAPVFGVKLIEAIQRIFTWFGKPLLVDAENWMAHPGAANTILNIFQHSRTPQQFIILSGDVHYSFVYDIQIRFRQGGPKIYQITSSGIKNEFPERLLSILDRLNRWLYATWSPLNWFTKRRLMRVRPRSPSPHEPGRRLVNQSGIGWVSFDENGQPKEILQLSAGARDTRFDPNEEEEHWS